MDHMKNTSSVLVFFVNGKKVVDHQIDPEWTLLFYLRNKLRLCGTKSGCGEGGCGACTVMVSKYDRTNQKIIHLPVNACLAPICSMHGLAVTTVEGIGSTRTKLHPVQERIAKSHGTQCGFCTPGIVMSMYTLLRNSPKPTMKDLEVAFQGNLCRCTGYRPIMEGYKTFTEEWELIQNGNRLNGEQGNGCAMGDKCCKLQNGTTKDPEEVLFNRNEFTPYDSSQEPIFPPELKISDQYDKQYLVIKGKTVTWFRPVNLEQLLQLKKQFPGAKLVVGNTEVGVEVKFKQMVYPVIIQPVLIPEMVAITNTEKGVRIGASATFTDIETYLKNEINRLPEEKTRIFKSIVDMLNWFSGKQIRSVGALGSNIMTGSPISDMLPILMANEVTLELQSWDNGKREVLRRKLLYCDRYCYAYKQAKRREDDIAIVNAAVNVNFEPKTDIISDINVAFGGMSYKTVTSPKTRQLKGLPWNRQTLELAFIHLQEDLPLDPGAPGGMYLYRKSLTLSLFFKAFLAISADLEKYVPHIKIDKRELSGITSFESKEYKSAQYFTVVPNTQEKSDALQRPIIHKSAYKHATGEAIFCDDIPFFENELYLAFVTSTKSHAKILSVDTTEALAMQGVHYFVSAKDLDPGKNCMGYVERDEKIFYTDIVTSQGQIIGGIVASDEISARKAARKVRIEYEDLYPVIVTIADAIKHNSFFKNPDKVIVKGDVEKAFHETPHVLEGECHISGQEHFYLETQSVVVVPKKEDQEMEIYSATQCPSQLAEAVAQLLGIQQNKIVVKAKRVGGGFGGKETKCFLLALPAAVAAVKLNRPIRCVLDRDEDIVMTGGRHPFLIKYKVAFNNEGKILGAHTKFYNNCGYSIDVSSLVLEHAMTHFQNSYNIPVVRLEGYTCKTNLPSNTAFRATGCPQAMFSAESMLQDISDYLNKDPVTLRELNLYREGDTTFYNQKHTNCTLQKCWNECLHSSRYLEKRKEVDTFNRENRYKKRGLSVIPTTYGVGFPLPHLHQAGALVLVYTDGSVLLNHGGVEMGQGVQTKMLQVASRCLEIPIEKIHTVDVSTDKVPNSTATAASVSSDLNGMAVLQACNTIKERLKPYKETNPEGTWEEWVKKAYFDRVSLSSTGYYKDWDDFGYNWDTGEGRMYNYYTYGAACCEVEIDTLTGDHQVHSVDIVMDLGESLNPAIDVGQIEGAFMQGYGLFVLEELIYSPDGTNYSRGPGTYKIPGFGNIPGEFNVSLLKGSSNSRAVYSSKAIGEPPLFLGSSVAFAIRDAIKAARKENDHSPGFKLDSPATPARIRLACQDNITSKFQEAEPGTFTPWNVLV
ncbi:hypothetical protein Zmor_025458 [Zophobas morio]|uniref:Xanthine dehydrogenase n=1 Tax=Zophobas morio TaxID=2755281 RepID=A0AA38M545_9CUCU|nr:hypothetical protein Zmor_025458 [Zophobas morio]